jgi:hypothetical protein
MEYSKAVILHDTKNILYQNFVEKYCKQMQVSVTFGSVEKASIGRSKYRLKVKIHDSLMIDIVVAI